MKRRFVLHLQDRFASEPTDGSWGGSWDGGCDGSWDGGWGWDDSWDGSWDGGWGGGWGHGDYGSSNKGAPLWKKPYTKMTGPVVPLARANVKHSQSSDVEAQENHVMTSQPMTGAEATSQPIASAEEAPVEHVKTSQPMTGDDEAQELQQQPGQQKMPRPPPGPPPEPPPGFADSRQIDVDQEDQEDEQEDEQKGEEEGEQQEDRATQCEQEDPEEQQDGEQHEDEQQKVAVSKRRRRTSKRRASSTKGEQEDPKEQQKGEQQEDMQEGDPPVEKKMKKRRRIRRKIDADCQTDNYKEEQSDETVDIATSIRQKQLQHQDRDQAAPSTGTRPEATKLRKFIRGDPRPVEQIPCELGRIPAEEILRKAALQTEPAHWKEERQYWYGWEDWAEQQPSALQQDEAGGQIWAQQQDQAWQQSEERSAASQEECPPALQQDQEHQEQPQPTMQEEHQPALQQEQPHQQQSAIRAGGAATSAAATSGAATTDGWGKPLVAGSMPKSWYGGRGPPQPLPPPLPPPPPPPPRELREQAKIAAAAQMKASRSVVLEDTASTESPEEPLHLTPQPQSPVSPANDREGTPLVRPPPPWAFQPQAPPPRPQAMPVFAPAQPLHCPIGPSFMAPAAQPCPGTQPVIGAPVTLPSDALQATLYSSWPHDQSSYLSPAAAAQRAAQIGTFLQLCANAQPVIGPNGLSQSMIPLEIAQSLLRR